MPTRPADRQFELMVQDWPFPKQWLHMEPLKNWRAERGNPKLQHCRVTLVAFDERGKVNRNAVRFHVHIDPRHGDLFLYSVEFFPGPDPSATDFRLPFATYLRVIRYAIAKHGCEADRYEIRNGKIFDLGLDAPITRQPAPRRYHRDERKRVELDHVAEIYRTASRAPTKAVQRALRVSWRTAARRVAEARAAGLLPPVGGRQTMAVLPSARERK